jgi:hypothetical protein
MLFDVCVDARQDDRERRRQNGAPEHEEKQANAAD